MSSLWRLGRLPDRPIRNERRPYGETAVTSGGVAGTAGSVTVEFTEVLIVPFSSHWDDGQWDATRECDFPWAEIQAKHVIFSLQTDAALAIPSISQNRRIADGIA